MSATDFQVGDRVSVVGVVTHLWPDAKPGPLVLIQVKGDEDDESELWFSTKSLTLVERPKRKLRVGSVWKCIGVDTVYHALSDDLFVWYGDDLEHRGFVRREEISFDSDPQFWREVPVEELE